MMPKRIGYLVGKMQFRWETRGSTLCFRPLLQRRWTGSVGIWICGHFNSTGYSVHFCPYIDDTKVFKTRREAQKAVEKALGLEKVNQ